MIHFEIPKNQSSIIKVIGVGGGGGNAVNYMYELGIDGVDFIVCNTDSQALEQSSVPNKIQLGPHLTQGLGAGANPEIGKQASEESIEDISKLLKVNTRMAFVTAGMGGGTGTGGAPVVSKICRDLGILTVGIVTLPFPYEGRKRMKQAEEGIDRMREHVDTILIISNDKLRQQFGNLPFTQAFAKADDILATAAKCITDVINTTGQVNVDFADVCTVMKNGGVAILGNAEVSGQNRASEAVEQALNSPLLNDSDIKGAKWILLNITSAPGEFEHTMDEAETIQGFVQQQAGDNCDVILGMGHDPNLEDRIGVTIIATGFNHNKIDASLLEHKPQVDRIVLELENKKPEEVNIPISFQKDEPKTFIAPEADQTPVEPPQSNIVIDEDSQPVRYDFVMKETEPTVEESKPTPEPDEQKMEINFDLGQEPTQKPQPSVLDMLMANKPQSAENKPQSAPEQTIYSQRDLSPTELEEKQRFEEQKRALEERAERLRRMSFNINGTDNAEDIENIPAYVRRDSPSDSNNDNSMLSKYTVGRNKNQDEESPASIQSINTFLDGKKPD